MSTEQYGLYNAQDTDISGLTIMPDPHMPMLRGMTTVKAAYTSCKR